MSRGIGPPKAVGEPTIQGAGVTGIQADGAPSAAITAGLAGLVHRPNGGILTIGILLIILAAGLPLIKIRFSGNTLIGTGATPNEHCINDPVTMTCAMV